MGGWIPPNIPFAIGLLFVTMICWGSWANSMKKIEKWRLESYYLTYAIGLVIFSAIYLLTLGAITTNGLTAFSANAEAGISNIAYAFIGGILWNLGNILLIFAIAMVGFAFAFPVGVGLALVVGSVLSYLVAPHGVAWLEFSGLALIIFAIASEATAYNLKNKQNEKVSVEVKKGLIFSIFGGILIGTFPSAFALSIKGSAPLDSYGATLFLTLGALLSSVVVIPILMKKPLIEGQKSIDISNWLRGKPKWHMWALAGALAWTTGTVFDFISAPIAGVTISYILGQAATMVGAIWGIFVWKEMKGAPTKSWILVCMMFVFFVAGIVLTILAAK